MRILHTADWHLGHRLYDRDRTPEHRAALAWLLETIEEENVDVLIVAGDIFDVANPSNQARELYYEFLGQLARTKCAAAVIVGGNHDSPAMLDAPKEVLKWLNLHVVGAARTQVQEEVVLIAKPGNEAVDLIVAAVPYLRERDIRRAKSGETSEERLMGLQEGISNHYREVAAAAESVRKNPETPIIATGHLFAGGASDHAEKKSYIYQADEHNIEGGQFPKVFDYVALGHIHRAQRVGGAEHIRYCGSLIPLTFVEGQQVRSVRIVDIGKAGEPITSRQVNVPYFRTLLRLNAELDEVKQALRTAAVAHRNTPKALNNSLPTSWAEIRIKTDEHIPNLRQTLLEVIADATEAGSDGPAVEILRVSQERLTPAPAAAPAEKKQLGELDPEEVFSGIITADGYTPERATELMADFRNLRNWMNDAAE
ncbi:exonuclease subunit SbcD [Neolewinella aurantiaca]|uniref:Nuclease SbcCD subunit D n=1 Tax=Neolewinella aurantiaca TaxID=2602767 RepID=A0A5C7FKH3_9BACT|nr:exonuclease SbcCD subunit D C-terminal domain-containing protein [Neolewinella aurantiaca]TXF91183.1 exonuclease subunit SbcD [Neolewinella aurantiaca]